MCPESTAGRGFWPAYADSDPVDCTRREAHHSAYLATGLWHYHLVSGDRRFLDRMWPAVRLGRAIRDRGHRFDRTWLSKEHYAMDWFYPVLSGVFAGDRARRRLMRRWSAFVEPGQGCRCAG